MPVGYVELEDNYVYFVFPEHPDEQGNPRRVPWREAAEADLIIERTQTYDPKRAHRIDPPV